MVFKTENWRFESVTPEPDGSWKFIVNSPTRTVEVYFENNTACAIYTQTTDSLSPTVEVIRDLLREIKKLYPNGF